MSCRDGESIERGEDDEKYGFSYDGSELTIHKVEKNDEAEYVCIAENKAGEHDATVHLKVFGESDLGRPGLLPGGLPPPSADSQVLDLVVCWQLKDVQESKSARHVTTACRTSDNAVLRFLIM